MTSNDLSVTFDPYCHRQSMEHGLTILLTKFGGLESLFVKQVVYLVKLTFLPFWTPDKKLVIDFWHCLIKTHMITKFGEHRTRS